MYYLFLAILCSVAVSVLLKQAQKYQIIVPQAIAFNYVMAISLCYFLLKPDFNGLSFTEFFVQSDAQPIFLALGILLPSVFIFMGKSVQYAGIVRSDAAQRLALIIQIIAAVSLFNEAFTQWRIAGVIVAFLALLCLLTKPTQGVENPKRAVIFLILVWLGYGIIGCLFKQIALMGGKFPTTLFISFIMAGAIIFIYLVLKRTIWTTPSLIAGLILGCLNFFNILFYIKAHQTFSQSPTVVFAGMDIGVICLGTIVGALIFKEKISKINGVGVFLGICAILILYGEKIFA